MQRYAFDIIGDDVCYYPDCGQSPNTNNNMFTDNSNLSCERALMPGNDYIYNQMLLNDYFIAF